MPADWDPGTWPAVAQPENVSYEFGCQGRSGLYLHLHHQHSELSPKVNGHTCVSMCKRLIRFQKRHTIPKCRTWKTVINKIVQKDWIQ